MLSLALPVLLLVQVSGSQPASYYGSMSSQAQATLQFRKVLDEAPYATVVPPQASNQTQPIDLRRLLVIKQEGNIDERETFTPIGDAVKLALRFVFRYKMNLDTTDCNPGYEVELVPGIMSYELSFGGKILGMQPKPVSGEWQPLPVTADTSKENEVKFTLTLKFDLPKPSKWSPWTPEVTIKVDIIFERLRKEPCCYREWKILSEVHMIISAGPSESKGSSGRLPLKDIALSYGVNDNCKADPPPAADSSSPAPAPADVPGSNPADTSGGSESGGASSDLSQGPGATLPITTGCPSITDRAKCCQYHDGRAGWYNGQPCTPASDGKTFSSRNVCEPKCWTAGTCGSGRPQGDRIGVCQDSQAPTPEPTPAPTPEHVPATLSDIPYTCGTSEGATCGCQGSQCDQCKTGCQVKSVTGATCRHWRCGRCACLNAPWLRAPTPAPTTPQIQKSSTTTTTSRNMLGSETPKSSTATTTQAPTPAPTTPQIQKSSTTTTTSRNMLGSEAQKSGTAITTSRSALRGEFQKSSTTSRHSGNTPHGPDQLSSEQSSKSGSSGKLGSGESIGIEASEESSTQEGSETIGNGGSDVKLASGSSGIEAAKGSSTQGRPSANLNGAAVAAAHLSCPSFSLIATMSGLTTLVAMLLESSF